MKRKFLSLRRLPVDFGNEPGCPVAIQRYSPFRKANGAELRRAREQAESSGCAGGPDNRSLTVAAQLRECPPHRANGISRFIVQNGKLELRSSRFNVSTFQRFNVKAAFTLVEILVVLVLLSMIVLALMAVFSGIQRAFRASLTQTDTLESGRAVMDLIASDLETMTPSYGTNWIGYNANNQLEVFGPVNFAVALTTNASPPAPLIQPLLSSPTSQSRTNILESIFILSKANINGVRSWVGTGYLVTSNLPDGTLYPLYRFYLTTNDASGPAGIWGLYNQFSLGNFTNNSEWSHLMDGVVNLTARAYDTNGVWMTNGYTSPLSFHVRNVDVWASPWIEPQFLFCSNAVPASVQIELGTFEDHTMRHAESLAGANQNNYLQNAAGQVHIFRQRVWIRNMDPTAYE
jgi:Tfp pilus assembly protein PilV